MGGEIALISSVIGLIGSMQTPSSGTSDSTAEMAAERAAQEEEQRQKEADERKRERTKTTDARTIEKKRLVSNSERKTTLANGGAGLKEDATVAKVQLKTKLGE